MNPDVRDDDPQVRFYDLDYPWPEDPVYAASKNDPATGGLVGDDIVMLKRMAELLPGPVLDLCCGTGRLSIPLAREGKAVVGVDLSKGQLKRFEERLSREPKDVQDRVEIVHHDVCRLDHPVRAGLAFIGFNSLNLIAHAGAQQAALIAAARHLDDKGFLLVEMLNPFACTMFGNTTPLPIYTRRDPETGIEFSKVSTSTPLNPDQVQTLHGVYDVISEDNLLRRYPYEMQMRHVFPAEARLMFNIAGLEVTHMWGGFHEEAYTIHSRKLIVVGRKARRQAAPKPPKEPSKD